jgi:Tfp pilus assembly protein PilN
VRPAISLSAGSLTGIFRSAKNAQDRPKTEEARKRNDQLRSELFELRSQQIKLSHDVEEVKREKDAVFQQAVGFHSSPPWI